MSRWRLQQVMNRGLGETANYLRPVGAGLFTFIPDAGVAVAPVAVVAAPVAPAVSVAQAAPVVPRGRVATTDDGSVQVMQPSRYQPSPNTVALKATVSIQDLVNACFLIDGSLSEGANGQIFCCKETRAGSVDCVNLSKKARV